MAEPRTQAGRKHRDWLLAGDDIFEDEAAPTVIAIEQEARADLLTKLEAEVAAIGNEDLCFCDADRRVDSDQLYVHRAAVLALLAKHREEARDA
jgi:hypothetical protein